MRVGKHAMIFCKIDARLCRTALFLFLPLLLASCVSAGAAPPFLLGADISWVQQDEAQGKRFSEGGRTQDILALLKHHGFNAIRLRTFYNPRTPGGYSPQGYCDLAHSLTMARRIKAGHMKFLLDFHYSDSWADPQKQNKPTAWAHLSQAQLEKAVHDYTRHALTALNRQSTPPDMVQVGNEINHGILHPNGKYWKKPGSWDTLAGLLRAGASAVRETDPHALVMLHLALGGKNGDSRYFLDNALKHGVRFDVIGESYYPKYDGTLARLKGNLTDLARRYRQRIVVVEYSQPNLRQINDIVHGLPNGKGMGTFIWEPTRWEGPALFLPSGQARPDINLYQKMAKDYR